MKSKLVITSKAPTIPYEESVRRFAGVVELFQVAVERLAAQGRLPEGFPYHPSNNLSPIPETKDLSENEPSS